MRLADVNHAIELKMGELKAAGIRLSRILTELDALEAKRNQIAREDNCNND